jgi:hypothetical protein
MRKLIGALSLVAMFLAEASGAATGSFLGKDKLWRPRQSLVFYLIDNEGSGFKAELDIRDMNIYQEGERPAFVFVVAPSGEVVQQLFIADDGIVNGNFGYKDGIFDMYLDLRYREYHRVHSPDGTPPGKRRSPVLNNPEKLQARSFTLDVPAAGRGIYRVYIGGCWDHWVSLSTSRAMPCGIYPGAGAMYAHGDQLSESYMYVPGNVKDVSFAVSDEVAPFDRSLKVYDASGKKLAETPTGGIVNFDIWRNAAGGQVVKLELDGSGTGTCLHVKGAPFILFPDAESAKAARGGFIDEQETAIDPDQQLIMQWAKQIPDAELEVSKPVNKKLAQALKAQNLDRNSPTFGKMKNSADMWLLTQAVKDGDPALVKRLLLAVANKKITRWGHNFSFDGNEAPTTFPTQSAWLFRSCWWPLNDGSHAGAMLAAKPHLKDVPAEVNAAMTRLFEKWSLARMVMEQGLCSNQWSYDLYHMAEAQELTESKQIKNVLDFQVKRFCTENNLGRSNPDTYPTSFNSNVKYSAAADTGMIGGGVPAEVLGHDSQYSLESTSNMARVWEKFRYPEILAWLEKYYVLKTHMTVSRTAEVPTQTFTGTCSPADFNSRTRYYTHKSPINDAHDLITYGKLWRGQTDSKPWPFLEDGSFVRTIDNTYFFVKTPSYYMVAYGGSAFPPYVLWNAPEFSGNSMSFAGYGNPGYGAYQYMVKKPGGISALWIPGCGPVLMGSNHNVMFTNAVWGKISEPVCKKHKPDVDPYVVSESFAAPQVEFDTGKRVLIKSGVIPYTPLKFRREITMHDDYIAVKLELTSEKDFQFSELYEAIPLFPDNRVITTAQGVLELPPVIITPVNKTSSDKKQWGINPDIKPVKTKFISVLANSGKGASIEFEKDVEVTFAQPLKYRREAATMSAASIRLPEKWTKGEKFTLSYLIKVK